jgi:hypothetical protein
MPTRRIPTDIGGFVVDAAIEEIHSYECAVTQFPVESGGTISDHVRILPHGLQLDCIVSDTPIGERMETIRGGAIASFGDSGGFDQWSDEAHEHFKKLRAKREPFAVVTSRQTYYNMVVEAYTPTCRVNDGHALRFQLRLRYIGIVTSERTTVKVSAPNIAKKQKLGTRPTKVPPEEAGITPARAAARERNAAAERARKAKLTWLAEGVESAIGPSWITGAP